MPRLTNTRYADDILLYARSLPELKEMTEILIPELNAVGLHLNSKKTKILHNENISIIDYVDNVEIDDNFI